MITARQARKINGFIDQAESKFPTLIAPSERMPPHPGHGTPVNRRIGQIIGPFSNPSALIDASRIISQAIKRTPILDILELSRVAVRKIIKGDPKFS
jgi:hypothetical protein